MKPTNSRKESCTPTSSNCVIWQGKDIPCLKICEGDSVSEVVFALAEKLCCILDIFDVKDYDLGCLNLEQCAPADFESLIQLLINKICALENITPPTSSTQSGCPNCVVQMAPCFYYNDPKTGDQVVESQLTDYVTLIGNTICNILKNTGTQAGLIGSQGQRISNLERQVNNLPTSNGLPQITPVCVISSIVPVDLDKVVAALEQQFCELRSATGTTTDIFQAISQQCAGLDQAPALGTQGGTMGSINGWKTNVQSAADAINNIWLTICDLRSAVTNIKTNCCATPCNGVALRLQATMPTSNQLILFFTGTIPEGLVQCNQNGTLFKITDQSGNELDVTINLIGALNNPSGTPIQLAGTPINTVDDLTISASVCFKEDSSGTICQSVLSYIFVNTSVCPLVTYISGLNSITFKFNAAFVATFGVELYDSTGNTLLQNEVFSVGTPVEISGVFNGLGFGTVYKILVRIIKPNKTTVCPLTVVTTLPNPCPPSNFVEAIITIP